MALEPGQRHKGDFLASLRVRLELMVDEELQGMPFTGSNCPWIQHYIDHFQRRPVADAARFLRRYVGDVRGGAGIGALLDATVQRARTGMRAWRETGRVPTVPPGTPPPPPLEPGDEVRRKADGSGIAPSPGHAAAMQARLGRGAALPGGRPSELARRVGAPAADIRLHVSDAGDEEARSQRARGLSLGDHVVVRRDRYRPGTVAGDVLLAHELAHTAGHASEDAADRAAVGAALGVPLAQLPPRRSRGGLALRACFESTESTQDLTNHHLRIVFHDGDTTEALVSGVYKYVLVAANESEDASGWASADDDVIVRYQTGYPRLLSVRVDGPLDDEHEMTHRPTPQSRIGGFRANFMWPGSYRITAQVQLVRGEPSQDLSETFEVMPYEFEEASRRAVPDDLQTISARRSLELERLTWYMQRSELRSRAIEEGLFDREVEEAWVGLSSALMVRITQLAHPTGAPSTGVSQVDDAVASFREKINEEGGGSVVQVWAAAGAVGTAARGTDQDALRGALDTLAQLYEQWAVSRIEDASDEDHEIVKGLRHALGVDRELREIEDAAAAGTAVKLPAVYHPRSAYGHPGMFPTEPMMTGAIQQIPLDIWLYREGARDWTLKDISNPEETFEYDVDAGSRGEALPDLLEQMRVDEEHLPEGILYIELPNGDRESLTLESDMDFWDWVQVAALVLAAAGLVMVTAGAATPGVVAVGGWLLTASAVTGGAIAIADTIDAYERGRLTGSRLALNALQVVASAATAGSTTILARSAGQGATALRAVGSNARYVMLNRVATGADIVTLLVMGGDVASRLSEMDLSDDQAGTAAMLLVGQFMIQGAITVVSARNDFGGDLPSHPHIDIADGPDGTLVVRPPAGAPEAPDVLPRVPESGTWESPLASSNRGRYDQLLEARGTAARELTSKPAGFTGAMEAEFRGYRPAEPSYRWVLDGNGNLSYQRARVTDDAGNVVPRRTYDPETNTFANEVNVTVPQVRRAWDHPDQTFEEFFGDWLEVRRRTDPGFAPSAEDLQWLRQAYARGQRINPETGRVARPTVPLPPPVNDPDLPAPDSPRGRRWQAYERGGEAAPCFAAGTSVHALGGRRSIEAMRPGDDVLSMDAAGRRQAGRVVRVLENRAATLVRLSVGGETLWTTIGHRFWVDGEGWRPAADLDPGALLLTTGGTRELLEVQRVAAAEPTYNLEVEPHHTYLVGVAGILVHNDSAWESRTARQTFIYAIEYTGDDPVHFDGRTFRNGDIIYVGKTYQGVDPRFQQHMDTPEGTLGRFMAQTGVVSDQLAVDTVGQGVWTPYETAVQEQHMIDVLGPRDRLLNQIDAITEDNFVRYRNRHNPC